MSAQRSAATSHLPCRCANSACKRMSCSLPGNLAWAAALVGFFGLFHGHAHGTELPAGENGLFYSLGFVIATGVLHGCGIALGEIRRWSGGGKVLRAMGAVIALGGVYFLIQAASSNTKTEPAPAASPSAPNH